VRGLRKEISQGEKMKYFSRPSSVTAGAAVLLGAGMIFIPYSALAQISGLAQVMEEPSHLLHSSSPGYMGVLVGDVDSDSASRLKLKEARGAVITLIDHDAPAAQAGIRVNDVVLQLNGQPIESAEQFSRMIREIPAGHSISLLISRDGATQTIGVELCDRKKMEHDVWNRLDQGGTDSGSSAPGNTLLGTPGGDVPNSPGFHVPLFGSSLNVGALVEPLTSQMADYLGIRGGLMIKQVAHKSEAEAAGLRAFDVILKVGTETIATSADWDRALRANQNKPVAVTILRDRKQQSVTLQVDSKHRRSELEELFPDSDCPLVASLGPDLALEFEQRFADDDWQENFSISPEQIERFKKEFEQQVERFGREFQDQPFKIDPNEIEEFRQQMRQFQSPEFNQQMREQLKRQMDQLKRQLDQMEAQGFDHMV
jgi:membrane-associated protease RseP (regulator of RpoE activity)